jgi:hypothetical protein
LLAKNSATFNMPGENPRIAVSSALVVSSNTISVSRTNGCLPHDFIFLAELQFSRPTASFLTSFMQSEE